jgi:hypothetical protein
VNLKVEDYFQTGKRSLIRFKEKGDKEKEIPVHHKLDWSNFELMRPLNRFSALMESATLWKVDATEAALRAEAGLDRFP